VPSYQPVRKLPSNSMAALLHDAELLIRQRPQGEPTRQRQGAIDRARARTSAGYTVAIRAVVTQRPARSHAAGRSRREPGRVMRPADVDHEEDSSP
jgi:hypothetical protein